ncbi:hypothetical protein VNO77_18086 [Canavalia gladiata]|uniref:Uncharacterized protein n=1 Tax=Canavalia gladiata TaxID=3824 RepID=A0AAN9LNY5_CANGL
MKAFHEGQSCQILFEGFFPLPLTIYIYTKSPLLNTDIKSSICSSLFPDRSILSPRLKHCSFHHLLLPIYSSPFIIRALKLCACFDQEGGRKGFHNFTVH